MPIRTAVPMALAALAVTVSAASAALPSPASKAIVPGHSIGGVKIGMDATAAVKKWGPGGSCATTIGASCSWDGKPKVGSARFDVTNGKVSNIVLRAGQKPDGTPIYKGPITKWKTSKGVAIGTLLYTVGKKYPKAKPDGSGLSLASGKLTTFFESSGGRTFSIAIGPTP